jgi:rubredoxin
LIFEEPPLEDDDSNWYCPRCKPIIEKRNLENLEKLQRINEKD